MNLSRKPAARTDLWNQWDWYVDQGVPRIAEKFFVAVANSFAAILKSPSAGAPRRYNNPRLEGLRVWPIKGFKEIRIYYLVRGDTVIIVRILHDKRDAAAILEKRG